METIFRLLRTRRRPQTLDNIQSVGRDKVLRCENFVRRCSLAPHTTITGTYLGTMHSGAHNAEPR